MRKLFAPEVVQTSNLDCGPASLKSLLEAFGTHVSYGRLREACQTEVDGTSIDAMEEVANQLGLEAEQIMLPADHLLLPQAHALPAIIVVTLPNGLTHFVVAWRRYGRLLQIMDPAIGRRWVDARRVESDVYRHTLPVEAAVWREFAASPEFQACLSERLRRLDLSPNAAAALMDTALSDPGWRGLAALDAAARLVASLLRAGGIDRGTAAAHLVGRLAASSSLIPAHYWSVGEAEAAEDGSEQVTMRGAVLVRVRGKRAGSGAAAPGLDTLGPDTLGPELTAAVAEPPLAPGLELLRLVRESGIAAPLILSVALAAAAAGLVFEALLFRGLLELGRVAGAAGPAASLPHRLTLLAAVFLYSAILLLLEAPILTGALRLGRHIENRLRMAFLLKIPKLGDRYFQSRLTSDMAERSHASHRLRRLPDLARQLLRAIFELCITAAAILWLLPSAAPWVGLTVVAALLVPFLAQPVLAERDARVRNHAAGLTRFYLDAMLGLLAIRAHRAARSIRREHEKLLAEWARSALRLQRAVVASEAVQLTATFGLIVTLLLTHPLSGVEIGRLLLVVYWALNLPALGQEIGALARQYPYARNLTLRLLDPLGAPEEEHAGASTATEPLPSAPRIEFRDVAVTASGHAILTGVDLDIAPASHIVIVGPSGAGKSSLVGILLGWLKPAAGEVLIDGRPLDVDLLRRSIAWVDPAVQLWNRPLLANLRYGSGNGDSAAVEHVIDAALLEGVLSSLPHGLETPLGEGGGLVSGGEGQRVRLARAMLRRHARLVILDEPFRGLDRGKRRELLLRAREFWRDCTLLCITHDVSETVAFDRVLVVEGGRVVEDGAPAELASSDSSRYTQLLAAERDIRAGIWSGNFWRRLAVDSGKVSEVA